MSAFLGPIHHWLYNKIKVQDNLTEKYIEFASNHNFATLREDVDAKYDCMPQGDLADLIDEGNIHGWLQAKIHLVENRYAYVITQLVSKDPSMKDELKAIAKAFGQEISPLTAESSAEDAYQVLNNTLIDGMPCDHVNMLLSTTANEVVWKRTQCVHESFWIEQGSDATFYYELREQLIQGILSVSELHYDANEDGTMRIYK